MICDLPLGDLKAEDHSPERTISNPSREAASSCDRDNLKHNE